MKGYLSCIRIEAGDLLLQLYFGHGTKNVSYRSPITQNKITYLCGATIRDKEDNHIFNHTFNHIVRHIVNHIISRVLRCKFVYNIPKLSKTKCSEKYNQDKIIHKWFREVQDHPLSSSLILLIH